MKGRNAFHLTIERMGYVVANMTVRYSSVPSFWIACSLQNVFDATAQTRNCCRNDGAISFAKWRSTNVAIAVDDPSHRVTTQIIHSSRVRVPKTQAQLKFNNSFGGGLVLYVSYDNFNTIYESLRWFGLFDLNLLWLSVAFPISFARSPVVFFELEWTKAQSDYTQVGYIGSIKCVMTDSYNDNTLNHAFRSSEYGW